MSRGACRQAAPSEAEQQLGAIGASHWLASPSETGIRSTAQASTGDAPGGCLQASLVVQQAAAVGAKRAVGAPLAAAAGGQADMPNPAARTAAAGTHGYVAAIGGGGGEARQAVDILSALAAVESLATDVRGAAHAGEARSDSPSERNMRGAPALHLGRAALTQSPPAGSGGALAGLEACLGVGAVREVDAQRPAQQPAELNGHAVSVEESSALSSPGQSNSSCIYQVIGAAEDAPAQPAAPSGNARQSCASAESSDAPSRAKVVDGLEVEDGVPGVPGEGPGACGGSGVSVTASGEYVLFSFSDL